jgi:hypothetical protein
MAGDVCKYGETTQGSMRYGDKNLKLTGPGVVMAREYYGNKMEIKIAEKAKIYGYDLSNFTLPPGNKIFR